MVKRLEALVLILFPLIALTVIIILMRDATEALSFPMEGTQP